MISISLCMIVKNEEAVLARCLDSVTELVDEIVILDTGSTDRTRKIAAGYTDKIYDFNWKEDFASARNESFSHAEKEFILWLDADDLLREEDRKNWLSLKETLDLSTDMVMAPYHVSFDERGQPTFTYYRERLIRNGYGFRWVGRIHEVIPPGGSIRYTEAAVCHRKTQAGDPDRNLRIFEQAMREGETLDPRQRYYYGRELYYHARYEEAKRELEAFLQEKDGWVENKIGACQILAYCAYRLGKEEAAIQALLRSFLYDCPRAELCCDIGRHFFDRQEYRQAIYWYERARECSLDLTSGAFVQPDCYGYIPCLQLCVCYDRLGDRCKARAFNELAGAFKPGDKTVKANQAYFASLGE